MLHHHRPQLAALIAVLLAGCASDDIGPASDAGFAEAGRVCSDPNLDQDGDGILNGAEECLSGRDTDKDGVPDWQDYDSDGDRIPDSIERGPQAADGNCALLGVPVPDWPCDSDGDGYPDFLDIDSDNDGMHDVDEDVSSDGQLGCCLISCGEFGSEWQSDNCLAIEAGGCGAGQTCTNGLCQPAASFECSNGETDPRYKDTFLDGRLDTERGTFICREATEDRPGRKASRTFATSPDTGDWTVALSQSAEYADLVIAGADKKETAAVFDEMDPLIEVAGFVLSRDSQTDIQSELSTILQALSAQAPGGSGTVSVRSSGTTVNSHDKFHSVQGTILDVSLTSSANVSTVRNGLVALLLGRDLSELSNLPGGYGQSGTEFIVRFVTVKRFGFVKDAQGGILFDAQGNPSDNGDTLQHRLVMMGSVALRNTVEDPTRKTGLVMDDLSNGTALATASDTVGDECDAVIIEEKPAADIIWVVDESGSMDEDRANIVANAKNFFSRALSSGLDFRMGVTNVCWPGGEYAQAVGKFCSTISTMAGDMGGEDRFLSATEQDIFGACINNPPGYEGGSEYGLTNAMEAVKRHLPRAAGAPEKIRPEATLVIIMVTDEISQELQNFLDVNDFGACSLNSTAQAKVDQAIAPYLELFSGAVEPEAAAMFHLIGGVCADSCGADVSHGYRELAQHLGGQIGDVCQQDLGSTMQVIIDSIVGAASPAKLEYVPISSSLAVAVDGRAVSRSRSKGFDYRSSTNSLVFIDVPIDKGIEVVASYERWTKQLILQ